MKNYLVCKIEPFIINQKIDIFINNELQETVKCKLDDLEKVIYNLCKEKSIEDVRLSGNSLFCMKFSNNIINYNKDIPINVIFCA